jgi:hypothetical protein
VNLKPSFSTEARNRGTVASKSLLIRMWPCGVSDEEGSKLLRADVVDVADPLYAAGRGL